MSAPRYAPVGVTAPVNVDVDTQDYYDEELPPPHRLSTLYSHSPYHEALPPASRSGHYSDPFVASNSRVSSRPVSTSSSSHHASQGPYNDYDAVSAGHHYPAPYGTTYGKGGSEDDLHEHGAWEAVPPGMGFGAISAAAAADRPEHMNTLLNASSEPNQGALGWTSHTPALAARERYMQRKSAQYGGGGYGEFSEKGNTGGSHKRKWWLLGGIVALIVVIAIGAGVGVAVNNSKKSKGASTAGVVKTTSSDPSSFKKDSRLKQSFYAMCYTPFHTQYPSCGAAQSNVTEDIQLLSQLTTRLRLYGADCDASEMVLTAIEQTKVNMNVWLGLWVDENAETWTRQFETTKTVLSKHGVKHVEGLIVGNEYMLNGGNATYLLAKIQEVKAWATSKNFNVKIATADAGSVITTEIAQGVDVVMANVHAWFAGTTVADAAGWTWDYTNTNTPGLAVTPATNAPDLWIAETGWPTSANDTASMTYEGAVAGDSQLQTFLDTFVCQANANITAAAAGTYNKYAFFEAFDEPWKSMYGGVEPYWGLFDSNKNLKNVTIPDCSI
ncbi:unnamed protein product [Parajaminaea phylloscopi]